MHQAHRRNAAAPFLLLLLSEARPNRMLETPRTRRRREARGKYAVNVVEEVEVRSAESAAERRLDRRLESSRLPNSPAAENPAKEPSYYAMSGEGRLAELFVSSNQSVPNNPNPSEL